MEGFKDYTVWAKNVTGCHWLDARTEDSDGFVKFLGTCINNQVETSYGTKTIDYDECMTYPTTLGSLIPVYSTTKPNEGVLEINTQEAKIFSVRFNDTNAKARVGIQYLSDSKGKTIGRTNQKAMMRPRSSSYPYTFYYNDGSSQWKLGADSSECEFVVPEGVSKIKMSLTGSYTGVTIYSDRVVKITER